MYTLLNKTAYFKEFLEHPVEKMKSDNESLTPQNICIQYI